jgi:hypothetical protein
MKDLIFHAIPQHDYFAIAVPQSWLKKSIDSSGDTVILKDPKSSIEKRCEIMEMWSFTLDEFSMMNAFSLLTYGIPAAKMVNILRAKYPEINDENKVRFILLKKP